MALITLQEYARRVGRQDSALRRKAAAGSFKTAVKQGRDWFIDENEPFTDMRISSGKYIGKRPKK